MSVAEDRQLRSYVGGPIARTSDPRDVAQVDPRDVARVDTGQASEHREVPKLKVYQGGRRNTEPFEQNQDDDTELSVERKEIRVYIAASLRVLCTQLNTLVLPNTKSSLEMRNLICRSQEQITGYLKLRKKTLDAVLDPKEMQSLSTLLDIVEAKARCLEDRFLVESIYVVKKDFGFTEK